MPRNPNDPIPGFEDEYTGTVGHEKAIHKTHFSMPKKSWRSLDDGDWVEVRPGVWKVRRRKEEHDRRILASGSA